MKWGPYLIFNKSRWSRSLSIHVFILGLLLSLGLIGLNGVVEFVRPNVEHGEVKSISDFFWYPIENVFYGFFIFEQLP